MNIEEFRDFCIQKKGVTEETPFGPDVLVFKVGSKIFALANMDHFVSMNLKCDPEKAEELRQTFEAVKPGYHMNKKHWNTVQVNSDMGDDQVYELIEHSYDLVRASLPKKLQAALQ